MFDELFVVADEINVQHFYLFSLIILVNDFEF